MSHDCPADRALSYLHLFSLFLTWDSIFWLVLIDKLVSTENSDNSFFCLQLSTLSAKNIFGRFNNPLQTVNIGWVFMSYWPPLGNRNCFCCYRRNWSSSCRCLRYPSHSGYTRSSRLWWGEWRGYECHEGTTSGSQELKVISSHQKEEVTPSYTDGASKRIIHIYYPISLHTSSRALII